MVSEQERSSQLGEHFRKDPLRPWLLEAPATSVAQCQQLISLPEGDAGRVRATQPQMGNGFPSLVQPKRGLLSKDTQNYLLEN